MLMSHACLTAILARKKPWEPPEPPAWKQPHEFKVGCVALSAATAVLNSGPPVTSTKSARQGQAGAWRVLGVAAPPTRRARRRRSAALGRGQRERELGVRLQVLHARVEGRDAHVGVAVPPSAKLTGLPNGYPAIEAWVEIVDIVPQVMLRTIQRAYAAWSPTAGTGTPLVARGLPGAWHVTRPASARSRVEVVPAMLVVPKDFRGHRPGAKLGAHVQSFGVS